MQKFLNLLVGNIVLAFLLVHPGAADPAPPKPEMTPEVKVEHEEGINTDRPHTTEAPYVLPGGRIQTENGVLYVRERGDGGAWQITFPTLVRVGTGSDWEFRFESDNYALQHGTRGLTDPTVGFKHKFYDDGVEISVLFKLNIPVGNRAYRAEGVEPDLKFLFSYEITDGLELEWNVGMASRVDKLTGKRLGQIQYVTSLTQDINETLAVYGEIAGEGPDQLGNPTTHVFDAGFLIKLNSETQLDIEYYRGLSSSGVDWGIGMGLSRRW